MKRIVALSALLSLLVMLVGCDVAWLFGGVSDEGEFTAVVENGDGTYDVFEVELQSVENRAEGVKGVLEYLSERQGGLYLELEEGPYGAFIKGIGSLREDSLGGAYIMVYTSYATDSYQGSPTLEYDGVTLYQSGVGVSAMTVADGGVVLFRLEVYSY